ncbi:MAG: YceD family protein [Wenzhouxiangella sp.]|jgi:uncharacterized protein|nr:YceD family protein [Wenzhouxiangella sp.]
MSRDYPDWINPFKAAQARRTFAGTMRLADFHRLVDLIDDPGETEIKFSLAFDLDDQREATVGVEVNGHVPMICQRTLKRFDYVVDSSSVVAIVDCEAAVDQLPEDYEPLVVNDGRLKIADLVAEELLLALPLVPRSPESAPIGEDVAPGADIEERHQPFAVLADLARKRD